MREVSWCRYVLQWRRIPTHHLILPDDGAVMLTGQWPRARGLQDAPTHGLQIEIINVLFESEAATAVDVNVLIAAEHGMAAGHRRRDAFLLGWFGPELHKERGGGNQGEGIGVSNAGTGWGQRRLRWTIASGLGADDTCDTDTHNTEQQPTNTRIPFSRGPGCGNRWKLPRNPPRHTPRSACH